MNPVWAFLGSFTFTVLLMPRLIPTLVKLKATQVISNDGPERHHIKQGTPTMGGIGIILGFLFGLFFASWIALQRYQLGPWIVPLIAVALVTIAYSLLGALDDYLIISKGKSEGLNREQKLIAQFGIAILFTVWLAYYLGPGVGISRLSFLAPSGTLWPAAFGGVLNGVYYVFVVLLMVWISNAVNISDGLDGHVAGLAAICAAGLSYTVLRMKCPGIEWLPGTMWALAGACLGFLAYNANPARVFMGDTSALAIGPGLAAAAILSGQEWLFIIFSLIFSIEMASVTIQIVTYKLTKRRIFKMAPLHHHLELCGWPEPKIVTVSWICGIVAVVLGIAITGP